MNAITLDTLVALLYRGPLESPPWHGFLNALCDELGCDNAGIVLRLSRQGTPPLAIWGRPLPVGEKETRRIRARHAALGHLDPLRNALSAPGAIHTLDEVIPREELLANPFYRQVLSPYGFEHMLGMYIAEPGGWEGNVGLTNGADHADFGPRDNQFTEGQTRPRGQLRLLGQIIIARRCFSISAVEPEICTISWERLIRQFISNGR